MDTKVCFKCNAEKSLSEFYKHKQMGDGHINKCKECTKKDVGRHREENIEKIRKYDRDRSRLPHRKELNSKINKRFRKNNPEKYKAHSMVGHAIRNGKLKKMPCTVCGTTKRIEAHHEDYNYPLNVVWLCSVHHSAVHPSKET